MVSNLINTKNRNKLNVKITRILIFILIICVYKICCVTDLTYLNCPDKFDINAVNVTTSSSSSIISFFYSLYDNPTHKNRVQNIVIQGNTADLALYISQMLIPYIIIAAFYFVFLMTVACCNILQKSCPPCESWKRDFVRRPYQKFQLKCVMIFTMIFSVGIFIVCIVMFTSFPVFKEQAELTKCSLYNALDITKNGDQLKNWGGFKQLKNQVGNISTLLTTASFQVNKYFRGADGLSDDDWLIDDMNKMKKANLDLYKNNKDSSITTPNPDTTDSTPVGDPIPRVSSYFITTGLGPIQQNNTMVNAIGQKLQYLQKLSLQAYKVQKAAFILVDSANTIKSNTESSSKTLQMYDSQLSKLEVQLNVFSEEYFSKLFNWGLYLIQGVVGFILAGSIFIIFGTISTQILDIFACRTLVNLGWVIYGLAYFGIIVLTAVLLSGGSLGYNFCNYYGNMLSNKQQFNRIGAYYSQNALNKLDTCIYGDGNVLNKFNIANQMSTVTQLFTTIRTYYNYEDTTSIQYINKAISTAKIQQWINIMEQYRLGIYQDGNPLDGTYDNPKVVIDKLNTYTKNIVSGQIDPQCTRDYWVFDKTNCTDASMEIYQATSQQSNGLRFTTTNDLCLSFNQKYFTDLSYSWNARDFQKRYMQVINCDMYDYIVRFGRSLINYRDSRIDLFQGLKDQLNSLLNLNTKFNTDLNSYKGRVDTFYSSVSTLNNLIMDKISGLLVSSDCRVVSSQLQFTNNVFCKNLMSQAVTLGLCSVILLTLMIAGIITSSVFAVRYARLEVLQKHSKRVIIPEGSLMSETFQKKKQSQQSSSSSSDQD